VGSVGQPRDLIPKAAYAMFDNANASYELLRVAYDVAHTQRKILGAGLPPFLAERLELGQ
jgi:diadenosine tetraphosphatase ApaH/serine/threonine PP2A family protein phosphatase